VEIDKSKSRPVVVKRVPERLNRIQAHKLLNEVRPFLESDRPQLVFDFANVRQMDTAGVEMLLYCVSQAMKRDGDVKLASVSREAATILELTRTLRLFEIYDSSTDAVRSFSCFLPNTLRFPTPGPTINADSRERAA
jgi:anti-sigma B factor antagonist